MRQIAELKTVLSTDPVKAIKLFEKIVEADDDVQILEACKSFANYIRHSSRFKRRIIFQHLLECSLLSRLYLGLQFNSFEDSAFPRKFIFEGSSLKGHQLFSEEPLPDQRHYVTSVGSNRCFNLALLSDGSPVPEPRVVDLPRVIRIEMSNQHTVFLCKNHQIYGCGKLSAFLPDTTGESGYVAEPTVIRLPRVDGEDVVREIRATDGGTQFCIGEKWYFIGKLPPNTSNLQRISSNCHVSTENSTLGNVEPSQYKETNVSFDGKQVKIFLKQSGPLLHWDRSILFTSPKSVHFVLNGIEEAGDLDSFQVLSDGTIFIGKNGILKGKLELWKNADDGFQVKTGTVLEHFDTKYSLVALLEELPGTNGADFFKVSPDGQNLIMKKGHDRESYPYEPSQFEDPRNTYHWQSIQSHLIIQNRQNDWPVDIPMDLTVIFQNQSEETEFMVNRMTWNMIHPGNGPGDGDQEYFIRQNANTVYVAVDWERNRPEDPSVIYLPPNTPPNQILTILSIDGQRIQCHKYLHLLHSRQIIGFLDFQITLYGAEEQEKPLEIKGEASGQTIRNALTGMIDIRTLYDVKTIELIECINYYNYHLMDELFQDAMHILMDTVTEYTIPFLYTLYDIYPEAVIDGLVKRPELLFYTLNVNPAEQPPKELLVDFAAKFESNRPRHRRQDTMWDSDVLHKFSFYDPEYVIRSLVNLEEDSEDVIWNTLRIELSNNLDSWHSEVMKRKEEEKKQRTRSRNSSGRLSKSGISMTSSPIPIGSLPNTESFSKSVNSPIAQSPLAFSMSPMTKASPIGKPRQDSISNSFSEDFPEVGSAPSSSTPRSMGRFIPKGTKLKKDLDILKTPPPLNPWKVGVASNVGGASDKIEEEVDFGEVVKKEEKLQKKIRTGNKKEVVLAHVELEELAMKQILEIYKIEYFDKALVRIELDDHDVPAADDQQNVWGSMPGLVRR